MKKKYKVAPEIRQQFIDRIKNDGLAVAQAAKDAGVSETAVYGWLGKGAESVPSILELAKLGTGQSCFTLFRLRNCPPAK
jgi:transposase